MKVLVTGATGFIGNHTVASLLDRGHEVTAVARNKPQRHQPAWLERVNFIAYDLYAQNKEPAVSLGMPDALVHLAWPGLSDMRADFHVRDNLPADTRFLVSMLDAGLPHLLVAGTCFEYGLQEGCLNEQAEARPVIPYAAAKHLLHLELEKRMSSDAVLQWVRIFYLHGPGQASRTLMAQLDAAIDNNEEVFNMSAGDQQRDYLPVEQVAERLAILLEHPEVCGTINCCSGKPVTIRNLVESRARERASSIRFNLGYYPYPDDEPMSFWGDASKLDAILGN